MMILFERHYAQVIENDKMTNQGLQDKKKSL